MLLDYEHNSKSTQESSTLALFNGLSVWYNTILLNEQLQIIKSVIRKHTIEWAAFKCIYRYKKKRV